jgi:hypothetical protein
MKLQHSYYDWKQVIALMIANNPQGIPDPSRVLPYLGLYTLVHLKPRELEKTRMSTPCLPGLSVLRNRQWVPAPSDATPTTPNVARIFDARAIPEDPPESFGGIPLYTSHPEYSQTRYWRLPVTILPGILSAVMLRAMATPIEDEEEQRLARSIFNLLSFQRDRLKKPSLLIGGASAGPSGDESGGPSGGGSTRPKRQTKRGPQDKKSPKKPSKRARGTSARSISEGGKSCSVNYLNESLSNSPCLSAKYSDD